MQRFSTILILLGLFFASCVPNRKIVYLQKGNELKGEVVLDSVQRDYNLSDYEYRIQPEDILSIRFESLAKDEFDIFARNESQLAASNVNTLLINGYLVDKQGNIEFPELGKIAVEGLTLHEVQQRLKILAANYVKEPVVNIRLLNFRVTILGEVNGEGTISSYNNRLTLMETIGLSGGLTDLADRSKVKIIRQNGGKSEILYVNLLDEGLMDSKYFFVHQNDIIIVPPLKQRPFRRYFGQNIGLFLSSISTLLLIVNLIK